MIRLFPDGMPGALGSIAKDERWHPWTVEYRPRRDGTRKATRVPYTLALTRRRNNSPDGVGTLTNALDAMRDGIARGWKADESGVGISTKYGTLGVVALDFDACFSAPGLEDTAAWALPLVQRLRDIGAYIEVSPSGLGLRVLGTAGLSMYPPGKKVWRVPDVAKVGDKTPAIEAFNGAVGYVTVMGTGAGSPLADISDVMDEVIKLAMAQTAKGVAGAAREHHDAVAIKALPNRLPVALLRQFCEAVPCGDVVGDNDAASSVYFHLAGAIGAAWDEGRPILYEWALSYDGDAGWIDDLFGKIDAYGVKVQHPKPLMEWLRGLLALPETDLGDNAKGSVRAVLAALMGSGEDRLVEGLEQVEEPGEAPQGLDGAAVAEMFDRWAWVAAEGRFFDVTTRTLMEVGAWKREMTAVAPFQARGGNAADAIYHNDRDRRTHLAGVTSWPGKGAVIEVEIEGLLGKFANVWRPSLFVAQAGATAADAAPWIEHVRWLLEGDEKAIARVIARLAYIAQNPGAKVHGALLIKGKQRIGKDITLLPIYEALGSHNVAPVPPGDLIKPFTEFLAASLVVVNEMRHFGSDDVEEALKTWMAAPPQWLTVNTKYGRKRRVPNVVSWIMFSNHEDALKIRAGDGRIEVYATEVEPKEQAYYDNLVAWMRDGGSAAVVGWLRTLDLSQGVWRFHPTEPPPWTAEKGEMADATMSETARWVRDQFAPGGRYADRTLVTAREIKAGMGNAAARAGLARRGDAEPNDRQISDGLKEAGGVAVKGLFVKDDEGRMSRPWLMKPEKMALLRGGGAGAFQRVWDKERNEWRTTPEGPMA